MPLTPRTIIGAMQLGTERLLLRRPEAADLDAYAELFADPEIVRYTGGVTKSRAESELALVRMIRHWDEHDVGLFSVVRQEDGRVLGRVGFLVWDAEN
jgi:RimJ/RimL family protein N-acetyltransferase